MQRHLRLRRTSDYARLRQNGRVWRHRFFIVSMMPNERRHNRYGFVASKQLGQAVIRNRIRRHLRESVRHTHPYLFQGYDLAFIARKPIVGQPYAQIEAAVTAILRKAGLWAQTT